MTTVGAAWILLAVAALIVLVLNRRDRAALPDTKERREIEIRRAMRK